MAIAELAIEHASARFDAEERIAYIKYQGFLDAATSVAVYNWIQDLMDAVGIENIYGEIFDFRDVTEFAPDNLMEARKKSRRLNLTQDVKNMPVAMIVKDFYQEEILRVPMKNVPENNRKTIVQTMAEARAFLDAYHAQSEAAE